MHDVSCDKEELCEIDSFIPMPLLVHVNDTHALEPYTSAENKVFIPIPSAPDEQKLLSSLNILGYIEFDTLCALSSLEEKFECAEFPWLSRCTYHFIGKYNCKGDYMVHRVYICLNLNSPFAMRQYDQFEGCNIYNNVMWRNPSFVIKKQVKFQEGEQCWILPTTCPPTKLKPGTVCC